MKKSQKINLVLFVSLCTVIMMFAYFFGSDFLKKQDKPWHMQPSVSDEELSETYKSAYAILESKSVLSAIADTNRRIVNILVDAWGLPLKETVLETELSAFSNVPHKAFIHRRLANRTKHAEFVEFRTNNPHSMFLFGGDSLEYDRKSYIPGLGYKKMQYCQKCQDYTMISTIDSLLNRNEFQQIAWTATGARKHVPADAVIILKYVADLAMNHPDVVFIVQGTHRPILGTPERRRNFYNHWVPVVILN